MEGNVSSLRQDGGGGLLAPYLKARLMNSPCFVNWLVGAQKSACANITVA